jgi:5-methylthioadenosine/S-adenosylhomocysteine deaminase
VTLGLGTDGAASNNNLDLWGEMSLAAKLHKVAGLDPTVLPARQVVEMTTLGGARVLGLEPVTGSLTPGKEADLIVVDLHQPHLTPLYDPYSHLVIPLVPGRRGRWQGRWPADRVLMTRGYQRQTPPSQK